MGRPLCQLVCSEVALLQVNVLMSAPWHVGVELGCEGAGCPMRGGTEVLRDGTLSCDLVLWWGSQHQATSSPVKSLFCRL